MRGLAFADQAQQKLVLLHNQMFLPSCFPSRKYQYHYYISFILFFLAFFLEKKTVKKSSKAQKKLFFFCSTEINFCMRLNFYNILSLFCLSFRAFFLLEKKKVHRV